MIVFGVDAGTSVTKAVAFDEQGQVVAIDSGRTRLESSGPGRYEQSADDVVSSVVDAVRVLRERVGQPDAVGITGQGDGLWLADSGGYGVGKAISWMDGRAADLLGEWLADGTCDRVFRCSGNVMFPGSPGPLLAYVDRTEPELLDRASTAGYCKDVIMQRLTGARTTDASDASSPFLDVRTRRYDDRALAACGLSHRRDLLAPVASGAGPTGSLTTEMAALTGLAEGTPVTAGPFDVVASARGAGVTEPGDGLLIVGTTLACEVVRADIELDVEPSGMTLCTWLPDRWVRAMPAMVGTASVDWMTSLFRLDYRSLGRLLRESRPGADGVCVLPYLSPAGERAPFLEPLARGRIDGLSVQTTRADLVRAVCEAICYAARQCFETAGLTGRVTVCGGGAQCPEWLSIFASVLGRPIRLTPGPEVGARGAALTAASSVMEFGVDDAAWSEQGTVCEPDPELEALYDDGYSDFLSRLAPARAVWGERSRAPR